MKIGLRAVFNIFGAVILAGCGTPRRGSPSAPGIAIEASAEPAGAAPTAPIPILYPPHDPAATYPVIRSWTEVVGYEPYPYARELATPEWTAIDGVFAKFDGSTPQWWRCARCPDFLKAGGNWVLMLHQGTMHLYYAVTGFSTVSSYAVRDDQIELFNDPHCPYETGEYSWSIQDGGLKFAEINDPCAIHLRAENLTFQPWYSCQPPNTEAAISDHWIRPSGCEVGMSGGASDH